MFVILFLYNLADLDRAMLLSGGAIYCLYGLIVQCLPQIVVVFV